MKKIFVMLLPFFMAACVSSYALPQKVLTKPVPQCVYKPNITESEKAEFEEQYRNFKKAIYQNWIPPKNTKDEIIKAYFDISSTCQIMNIRVVGEDRAFKQSVINALQNTPFEGLESQEFKSNRVVFKAK